MVSEVEPSREASSDGVPRSRSRGTRDDWEILRDLIQAFSGGNGIYTIEDVFKQMSESAQPLAGLSLSKIGDRGVQVLEPS